MNFYSFVIVRDGGETNARRSRTARRPRSFIIFIVFVIPVREYGRKLCRVGRGGGGGGGGGEKRARRRYLNGLFFFWKNNFKSIVRNTF